MAERRRYTSRRAAAPAALAAVLALAGVAGARPAGAEEVSAAQLHQLVQRALADPAAAGRLRSIDSVDGQPVDLDRALAGATGDELRARLRVLDPGPASTGAAVPAGDPQADAMRILRDRRFRPSPVPRPFRGLLHTLGRWLRPIGDPLGQFFGAVAGSELALLLVALAVVALALLVSGRVIRRRSTAGVDHARRHRLRARDEDPDELDRLAAAAEQAGDLDLALRLRFRAGVLRLDRAGVVDDRPALTTGLLTRQLPSPLLRALALAFEEVAYGGRPASPADVAAARTGWPQLLEEAGRR